MLAPNNPPAVIAGPCVIESRELALDTARRALDACLAAELPFIFKASFDKANRTSVRSRRGPGMDEGLAVLAEVRESLGVPVTTDIHAPEQARPVAEIVDLIQIPAFLCRQTDLLTAAARAASEFNRAVNVKKGQFLSPEEMEGPVGKLADAGCRNVVVTERGTFFGYHRLVNDFIGVGDLLERRWGAGLAPAVCFDCTHSAQLPGSSDTTGGRRDRVPLLARLAAAADADALFIECHPDPDRAWSDASTMLPLDRLAPLLSEVARIAAVVRAPGDDPRRGVAAAASRVRPG